MESNQETNKPVTPKVQFDPQEIEILESRIVFTGSGETFLPL